MAQDLNQDNSPVSKDDIYDLLADDSLIDDKSKVDDKEDDEPIEAKKTKEIKLEDDEEEEKPVELTEEVEEPEEEKDPEDLDLVVPARKKEILTKYPNLFKDFPYLERAYYVDKQYTEMFGTIADAKQVIERSNTLANFEDQLQQGKTDEVLKSVKENDPAAFGKLVDNYLPDLAKVDEKAYYHIIGNVAKKTILSMANEGARLNNEHLKAAALVLNQFIFGNSQFVPEGKFSQEEPKNNEEQQRFNQERENFVREKFETVQSDLSTRATNVLKSTIEQNIDPRSSMSDYVKRNAVRDCMSDLESMIGSDRQFRVYLDNMWTRAAQNNFDRNSLEKIRSAYLSKAKTYLPSVIAKARNIALKGNNKPDKEERDKSGPISRSGKSAPAQSSRNNDSKQIPKGMKTFDFLNSD